ncbi:hypothetical protein [Desulfosporosinus sp. FKA]|uniref:hypothetical protein n=1 Tax=Desulfosporosinus sp. FKA TaxID=1969834 RepID=UPI000B4A2C61|nr:hypothetical protein [Desulfosporosinus sp. FKA]
MYKVKVLLTSTLVIGSCLLTTLPAMAATTGTAATNPNSQYWTQIKTLRQTDNGLAAQLKNFRQSIKTQRQSDWTQKNYTALLAAKNDLITMVNDHTAALTDRLTLQKDKIQLDIDRQAKNETNITADLQTVITDLNNQISARNQLITDAQKVQVDLGGSSVSTSTATAQ